MEMVERNVRRVIPSAAGALGFNITLVAWQGAGKLLGISCATPVAGPLLGGLAVASASIVAAQVANVFEAVIYSKKLVLLSKDSLVFHAAFGVILFKVLGGRYRNVMPSNLSYPGALARASVPARGSRYATDVEAQLVREFYNKYSCHHCGSRKGISIADHMPPNVVVKNKVAETILRKRRWRHVYFSIGKMASQLLDRVHRLGLQRFYPQCEACMRQQSAALRHGRDKLVFHFKVGFPEPPYLTGFFVSALKLNNLEHQHVKGVSM